MITVRGQQPQSSVLNVRDLSISYGSFAALKHVNVSFEPARVHAFIGPSGCGKSTLLRALNLMNWEIPGCSMTGQIIYNGQNILDPGVNVYELRTTMGMVFQQPAPFAMSIWDNLAFPLTRHGMRDKTLMEERIVDSLKGASLWDEVKDHLTSSALGLSGGQQQRLCIARSLVLNPSVLLMDEPCSALDPIATLRVEETIKEIAKAGTTVILVTHNMEQALRISDTTSYFYLGKLVESGLTPQIFGQPQTEELRAYLEGRLG